MANLYEECKKWISCVQQLDFKTVIKGLENIKTMKRDTDSDKILFKVLLYLSHSADRCYKEKLSKEIEIFTVANIICANLTTFSDKSKLFSAIYYIQFYLFNKKFFAEAKIITTFLFPGKILDSENLIETSQYHQISYLWYTEIIKRLDKIVADSTASKQCTFEDLTAFLEFHFQILKLCDEDYKYFLLAFDSYMKTLANIPFAIASKYLVLLCKEISSYINSLKRFPVTEAYSIMIAALGRAFYKRNDTRDNKTILECFRQCDSYIIDALKISSQCYNSYKLFREHSFNVLETNFMLSEIGEAKFKRIFDILKILFDKYGAENNALINTVTGLAHSFEIIFNNWEKLISDQLTNTKISYDDILKMGEFVKYAYGILKNRKFPVSYTCPKCPTITKCPVKKDINSAIVIVSSYLRLVAKFKSNAVNENLFALAKAMIEEMLLGYDELVKLGCKYSTSVWNHCGRTIFNIGLICESNYPAQYEGLYQVLCKEIVQCDGLSSKLGSFGLESPVATVLQRLCNVNLSQGNHRKALSYTAYNALLSLTENRKKKAYDMWSSIKLKCLDSNEIQELTLVNCLKTDKSTVENVGININLELYDLNDFYIQELKCLFPAKGNLTTSIQITLAELATTKKDLLYVRGVLLLCLHSLQHKKRKYILEYITKAIKMLNAIKPKTASNECLKASLNFFNIIEKLYAKRQAISEQMEDANFTIKSFKILQGKRFDYEEKELDEVVPTYGNISIEEDRKLEKELQHVLTTWNSYINKNLKAVIEDWEPKLLLETIVFCGEYCRLFKFNHTEELAWKIAHKLATALKDFATCLYVTSRSISLRSINHDWIISAEKYAEQLKTSSKNIETDVVILFWLSLADFYLDCKKVQDAKVLLKKVKAMSNFKLLENAKLYIYASDIEFRNYFVLNTETGQEAYCKLLTEIHYTLISLNDVYIAQETCWFWYIRFRLFAMEQVFEVMCNIVIPMCCLLSYREIFAHLIYGLQTAQKSCMTLRIAQYLKYYCYIYLFRARTDEVEAKLQDLEHILCLEHFHISMKSNDRHTKNTVQKSSSNTLRGGGESPELKLKIFSNPEFILDESNCQCFGCTHVFYQHLTFCCAYIRARQYSMLQYADEALQYYNGASVIKDYIQNNETNMSRKNKHYEWKRHQSFQIDELYFLLDFSMYISKYFPEKKSDAIAVVEEVLEIAKEVGLDKHPVGVYATELYQQHYVYEVLADKLCIQPEPEIPITITIQPVSGCITPKQQVERAPHNQRRRKSPQPIAIPVITIENTISTTEQPVVPKSNSNEVAKPKRTNPPRLVRRKLLVDEVDENLKNENEQPTRTRKRNSKEAKKSNAN